MDSGDRQASAKMGEGAGGRRASAISCGLHRLAEALGDRAHDRVDYAQLEDEPRLRVLVRDDGGSDLRGDDPTDAQKARQRGLMRPSQTPSENAVRAKFAEFHFHALRWIALVECASSPPGRVGSCVGGPRVYGRPLLWRDSGYRYPVVVLAVGQRSLLPRHQRPDALALLQHQREPVDLFVRHAICSLFAMPSCWFQELIFHAPIG